MEWLTGVLEEVAAASVQPARGRALPLVVINALGVGGGGFGPNRGAIVGLLLDTCQAFVDGHAVDVAIATPVASDYSALQHHRREDADGEGSPRFAALSAEQRATGRELAALARAGDLALFLGAGVSIPAGLPSWSALLERLAAMAGVSTDALEGLGSPLDQAEYLQRLLGGGRGLKEALKEAFAPADGPRLTTLRPSLIHLQLAALGCREVITTNYDSLYEDAVAVQAGGSRGVLDGADADSSDLAVLPFEHRKPFHAWILKLHGDLAHDGDVVLSRSDFVGYSSASGPVGSIVQSLMLTKHLLVVGMSLTDDNVLRLAYETTNYLKGSRAAASEIGTVLDLTVKPLKEEFWEGTFRVVGLAPHGTGFDAAGRLLSVMLDYIAMWSARSDWLLDPAYSALLTDAERAAAASARTLRAQVRGLGSAHPGGWGVLATALDDLGAGRPDLRRDV